MPAAWTASPQSPITIGMVHLGALPGTPGAVLSLREIETRALREVRVYREAGIDALLVENMNDAPFLRSRVGPEIVASMAILSRAVKEASKLPCGVQILAGANTEAIAVALAAGLDFVRVEGFAFAHVADEGVIESSAGELLRYRRSMGADAIQVWADIKKKHASHAITSDVGIAETAQAVEFMRGDAVIVTGTVTGEAPKAEDLLAVNGATKLPVFIGSGVTAENVGSFFGTARGFIVGSSFKSGGHWSGAVEPRRVRRLVRILERLRGA